MGDLQREIALNKNNGVVRKFSNEVCVVCGKPTLYLMGTPIYKRNLFVNGVGQVCRACFKELYEDDKFVEKNSYVHSTQHENISEQREIIKKFEKLNDIDKKYSDEFYDEFIISFIPNNKKRYLYRFVKRLFDLFVSTLSLLLLLPLFLVVVVAIKIDSKGSAFFKNRRVGRNGKIFNCLKFRSMATSAPKEMATSIGGTDSYITRVGKFIRKTSIDELPQLINVFLGQMSIIGYRPLVPTEQNCNDMRRQLHVFDMRPGISGFAQVTGRDDVYYKNKAIMDAYYVKNASIFFDIKIIFSTIMVVLFRKFNWDSKK